MANTKISALSDGGALASGDVIPVVRSGSNYKVTAANRETLTADRTYYVRTDGSDSNTGLANTSGGAFLTIQKAVDTISTLDLRGYTATTQIGNGTYSEGVELKSILGGNAVLVGDETTLTNVRVTPSAGSACFLADAVTGVWNIRGMQLDPNDNACIYARNGAVVKFQNIDCDETTGIHLWSQQAAVLEATGNYTISGSALQHWNAGVNAQVIVNSRTVTITGTPAFSSAYARANMSGVVFAQLNTYSGSATGSRYNADENGTIRTLAGTLPGDSAGSTATGGQYT